MKQLFPVLSAAILCLAAVSSPAADFNGDGLDDIAIFRPSTGLWSVRDGERTYWGQEGDIPAPGKFVHTNRDSIAIFRPSTGLWSVNGGGRYYFGTDGDVPIGGDSVSGGGGESVWTRSGDDIYYNDGDVGIGTNIPGYAGLDIYHNSTVSYPHLRLFEAGNDYARINFWNTTGSNYFAIAGKPQATAADARMNFFYNAYGDIMSITGDGDVGIGTTDPGYRLEVRDNWAGFPAAYIVNDNTGTTSKGLYIKLNCVTPGNNNDFIRFFKSGTYCGAIDGNGAGGVRYQTSGGDFAECLPRLDEEEEIAAGDIVGVVSGMVTRDTRQAHHLQVVSTAPAVLGNAPPDEKMDLYEQVAFIGRVPVRVRGAVASGDFIIPSGLNDGTGRAISPGALTSDLLSRIVGRSWESSDEEDVKLVCTAIGLQASAEAVNELSREKDQQIARLTERLESLERMLKVEQR